MTWCKSCMKAYHAEKRADPVALEKKRAAGLAHYYENKDAIAVANAEKYVANKDTFCDKPRAVLLFFPHTLKQTRRSAGPPSLHTLKQTRRSAGPPSLPTASEILKK